MKKKEPNIIIKMLKLVWPLMPIMILAIFLGTLGFVCAIGIPVLGALGIAETFSMTLPFSNTTLFVLAGVFALLRGVLRYAEQSCNHYIAFTLLAHIRNKVFDSLRRLCPAKLEGRDKGDLISMITGDIELLEVFYAHTISPIAIAIIMSILLVVFLSFQNLYLGLIALLAYVVIGILLPLRASRQSKGYGDAYRAQLGSLNSYVLDSLRGLEESIQYQNTGARKKGMEEQSDTLSTEEKRLKDVGGKNTALTNTMISLFTVIMLLASIFLFSKGLCSGAVVIISTITMASSFGPVVALSNLGTGLQQTLACARRVLGIIDEKPEVEDIINQLPVSFAGAACENVGFSYKEEVILKNISLKIPENKIVGIVGKSGSGKSTLLKLLMRFWDVKEGEISISERDLRTINTSDLRKMESYVTQDTWLFHDTIENNIKIAKIDATHEEVVEACKKASVHDFISGLPQGYQTQLGELGDNLSGGEQQRIGLARAFLYDAPMMLLDEPTSNLDSLNEAVILRALDEERAHRTVVLVSHRNSTMKIADEVYSVEGGRLS